MISMAMMLRRNSEKDKAGLMIGAKVKWRGCKIWRMRQVGVKESTVTFFHLIQILPRYNCFF